MKLSAGIIRLIQNWEGLRLTAYKCTSGVWTIGYGQTGTVDGVKIHKGMRITIEKADELFRNDTTYRMEKVANMLERPANQHEFDALVSLAYNIGTGALRKSSVLRYHNEGMRGLCAMAFLRHNKSAGVRLQPLIDRRAIEAHWYLYGTDVPE